MNHPILGIDYGDARIGIAATDPVGIMAHPVETIQTVIGDPIERIADIVNERRVQAIVLGLPLRMDGTEGEAAEKCRNFGELLTKRFPNIPLHFCDETMTTMVAADKLRSAGKDARKQKSMIDQAAAVEILNTWLGY